MVDVSASSDLRIFEDPKALAHDVAEWLCALAQESDREFAICLSGGSTPRSLYERLAEPAVASRFPWSRVHWFWGDERFVPHDDPDSNYRMACEALLSRVPVDGGNVHAVPTENLSPEQAAAAYEAMLKRFYGADKLESAASYLRRDVARHRRGWTHRFIVPRPTGARRGPALGPCHCRRKARDAHHIDVPGAQQQPRCCVPGNGRREAGGCCARPRRGSDAAGRAGSSCRAPALVCRSRCRSAMISRWDHPSCKNVVLSPRASPRDRRIRSAWRKAACRQRSLRRAS